MGGSAHARVRRQHRRLQARAHGQLAQHVLDMALVRQAGLDCQRLLLRDHPVYQAILDAAQAQEVDLIVMGTHGLGLVDRLFAGSQTQRVLARTRIPVLTLH